MLIDFDVFEDKTYTFFINDELCIVEVRKNGNGFTYEFKIDEEVDTPLNRWKKKKRKKASLESVLIFIGGSLVLIVMVIGFFNYVKMHKIKDLRRNGLITTATFTIGEHQYLGKTYNAKAVYQFRRASYDIHYNFRTTGDSRLLTPAGVPVRTGDQFFVTFSNWHPDNYRLSFYRPTPQLVEQYRQRLMQQYFGDHPQQDLSRFHCMFDNTFITKGVSGLADLFKIPEGKVEFKTVEKRTVLLDNNECR